MIEMHQDLDKMMEVMCQIPRVHENVITVENK
jgi:hypothetical protein